MKRVLTTYIEGIRRRGGAGVVIPTIRGMKRLNT